MLFPSEGYKTLSGPLPFSYPEGEEPLARQLSQTLEQALGRLAELLALPAPALSVMLVTLDDWARAPRDEDQDASALLPYITATADALSLVIPTHLDAIVGEPTPRKLHFLLYHELTYAFLERDPRPWPADYPLWADEWQLQFAALWLSQQLDDVRDIVNSDLHEEYGEIFETEEDGKTPVTIRGFDWDEETSAEDYLCFDLLLERFAADLLAHAGPQVLPRFLERYRQERGILLSDDVTTMLGASLDPGGVEWLESLPYF